MDTATFNGLQLGDGLLEFSTGNVERQVIERHLFGKDGIVTRDRGGGRQTITVTCYRLCADAHERATYVWQLARDCGNAKATLVLNVAGGAVAFPDCLLVSTAEEETAGEYVRFTMTFVRSAF